MSQISVKVFSKGVEIKTILRPLRTYQGVKAVKYRNRFMPLINGNEIHLEKTFPDSADGDSDSESTEEKYVVTADKTDPSSVEPIVWDDCQERVIKAPPGNRVLVHAGPGTGKTAVACARVAHLIDGKEIEPSRIWLISFTRTAVKRYATGLKII